MILCRGNHIVSSRSCEYCNAHETFVERITFFHCDALSAVMITRLCERDHILSMLWVLWFSRDLCGKDHIIARQCCKDCNFYEKICPRAFWPPFECWYLWFLCITASYAFPRLHCHPHCGITCILTKNNKCSDTFRRRVGLHHMYQSGYLHTFLCITLPLLFLTHVSACITCVACMVDISTTYTY